jgi:hypothetical protein
MRTFRGSSFCREPSDGDCGFGWFNVYNLRGSLEIASSQRANRTVAATTPGSAGACGLFADHRFVANRAMATAVSGGLSCTTSAEVLRSHRASELTGQSPLPFLARLGMRTSRGSSFCRGLSHGDCGFGWFNVYNLRRSLEIASSQRANRTVAATAPASWLGRGLRTFR